MKVETGKLAAIVLADVVGYSRLMGEDELETMSALNAIRRDLIDPSVRAYRGRLIRTTGDGFLLAFSSVIAASRCAIAFQQGLSKQNATRDSGRRIEFRIGLNVGDVTLHRGDIYGDGVNITARLEKLSEPGGLCFSRAAYDQIRHVVSGQFSDLGPHYVKNIDRPVEAFGLSALAMAGVVLPPVEVVPSFFSKRQLVALTAIASIVTAGVLGLAFVRWQSPRPGLIQQLDTVLKVQLPNSTSKARSRLVSSYILTPKHRAFTLAPNAKSRWYTGEWSTREEARDKVLERCQTFYAEPCALISLDDDMVEKGPDGLWPVRDMPKTHYAGVFNPEWIPGLRTSTIRRPDVLNYATSVGPKAVAYHVRGLLFVVTDAPSQNAAEEKALALCNGEPKRKGVDGPCFLYSVGNRVVLPERRTSPFTAP